VRPVITQVLVVILTFLIHSYFNSNIGAESNTLSIRYFRSHSYVDFLYRNCGASFFFHATQCLQYVQLKTWGGQPKVLLFSRRNSTNDKKIIGTLEFKVLL
jgi:hypothetical protein